MNPNEDVIHSACLAAALAICVSSSAMAQVSTTPARMAPTFAMGRPLEDLDCLTQLYNGGRWDELQSAALALVDVIRQTAKAPEQTPGTGNPLPQCQPTAHAIESAKTASTRANAANASVRTAHNTSLSQAASTPLIEKVLGDQIAAALDPAANFVVLTWIGSDPFGKTMLARVVVHTPSSEPFRLDLPGVGASAADPALFEVFLSRGVRGKIVSIYASTKDKDPITEELPAFLQAIASPLFAAFGAFTGNVVAPPPGRAPAEAVPAPQPEPTVAATVSRVGLPFSRATIKWKAVAKEPVPVAGFVSDVEDFVAALKYTDVPNAACPRAYLNEVLKQLQATAEGAACAGSTATTGGCRDAFDTVFRNQYATAIGSGGACVATSDDDRKALVKVDQKMREFVAANLTTVAEADITFKNRPLTHWTFGAGTGVLASASLTRPRVKLDDDKLVADPLGRIVTMSFVNWSPAGYDAESDRVTLPERIRPFFGVVMTPDFGLTGGVNVLLVRGIGVTAAGAVLFSKGADASEIGASPANPDKAYKIAYARGLVIGITYNFK